MDPTASVRIRRPAMFASDACLSRLVRGWSLASSAISSGVCRTRRLGRAMRAVRDNEIAAGVAGINVYRVKVAAFASARVLGGIGGGLFAGGFAYVSPDQFSFAEFDRVPDDGAARRRRFAGRRGDRHRHC